MSSRNKVLIALGVVAVLVVGGGLWWYLSDDAPPEVSLESAAGGVTSTSADGDATTTTASGTGQSDIDGTWNVDAATGEFDFQSATGSFAGFRISEELLQVGASEAVGRTGGVSGRIVISDAVLESADIEVEMAGITTDRSRRDDRVLEALEVSAFPTATFSLTEPVDLADAATDGSPTSVSATGDLTIHGVTKSVEFPLDAQLVDGTIVVVGSLDVLLSDYGVEAPTAPVVASVSDTATVELQLLFARS